MAMNPNMNMTNEPDDIETLLPWHAAGHKHWRWWQGRRGPCRGRQGRRPRRQGQEVRYLSHEGTEGRRD